MARVSRGVRLLLGVNAFGLVLGAAASLAGVSTIPALALVLLPLNVYLAAGLVTLTVLIPSEMNISRNRAALAWIVIGLGTIVLGVFFDTLSASLFAMVSLYGSLNRFLGWSASPTEEGKDEIAGALRDMDAFALSNETVEQIVNLYGVSMIERTETLSAELDARTMRLRLSCAPLSLLKHPISEIRSALTVALTNVDSQRERDPLLLGLVELAHYVPDREFQEALNAPGSDAAEDLVNAAKRREVDWLLELKSNMAAEQLDPELLEALLEEIETMLSSLQGYRRESGS